MLFMDFRTKRLGMSFTVSGSPVAATARFLIAVLFLARQASLDRSTTGLGLSSQRGWGSSSLINDFDEFGEAQLAVTPLATSLLAGHRDLLAERGGDPFALDNGSAQRGC